jgi:hypothetical protein
VLRPGTPNPDFYGTGNNPAFAPEGKAMPINQSEEEEKMSGLENIAFEIGLNTETAEWLNSQYSRMERGRRLLLDIALGIGEVLSKLEKTQLGNFQKWLDSNTAIPHTTGCRYISLYNYRNQIAAANSLAEAYKQIETLDALKKQTEAQKAYERVAEYRSTGKKPEGWRQHTDDKLAKEEEERDARIEAVKREALEKEETRLAEEKRRLEEEAERRERIEQLNREADELLKESRNTDSLFGMLAEKTAEDAKRAEFKEKIRLSSEGMNDPFQDAIIDYLDALENDSRRVEACYNIIKICRRIAVELQAEKNRETR